jgi:predicted TIM-barrel fold metal-dependent hydrolase
MIIDTHCHAGDFSPLFQGDHRPDDLRAAHEAAKVDAGIMSILVRDDMALGNDVTHDASSRYPGQIYGHAYLNPHDVPAALDELERCHELGGFVGVKLHPSEDAWFPYLDKYFPIYQRLEELGWPALFHSGTSPHSSPLTIAYAALQFPGIPFILGHFGLSDLSWECFPAAALADNIHVDPTANPMVRVMSEWIDRFGADRMLWGSDFPFYNVQYELDKLELLTSSPQDRDKIVGGNAQRIYRLPQAGSPS